MEKSLQDAKVPDKISKEFVDQAKKDMGKKGQGHPIILLSREKPYL
jgi:hypothetical protein